MSHTRAEVFNLLKEFDREFGVFQGNEEAFILGLLANDSACKDYSGINWERLSKASFLLPYCHYNENIELLSSAPDWFCSKAKEVYLYQVSNNEDRIEQIQDLACLFEKAGLKVLFLKGAAELAYFHEDTNFLGRRYMCDIDLYCRPEDLETVDSLLQKETYRLWDHNLKHWDRESAGRFTLDKSAHYIYNAYGKNYMELHTQIAVGPNRLSYPPDFEQIIFSGSRKVDLRGIDVWVPEPEHLFLHSLCHAASRNNNQELIYLDSFFLDEFSSTDCAVSPPVLVNRRLDICQLRYLLQMRELLARFKNLDFAEIESQLSKVAERDLTQLYTTAARYVFKEQFPVGPAADLDTISLWRQRYVTRYMLPLLAERIESLIESKMENLVSSYIQKEMDNISARVERRAVHQVTEKLLNAGKSFVKRQTGRLLAPGKQSEAE